MPPLYEEPGCSFILNKDGSVTVRKRADESISLSNDGTYTITETRVMSAQEALAQAKINAKKRELEEERERKEQERKQLEHQRQVDEKFFKEAIEEGKKIIDCIIKHSDLFGLGKRNKHNGYYASYGQGGTVLYHYKHRYELSSAVIDRVTKYFNDLGYGCEIRKYESFRCSGGMPYEIDGTLYLWIPTEEDNVKETKEEEHEYNGISW